MRKNKIIAISFLVIISGFSTLTLGKIGVKGIRTIINKTMVVYADEVDSNTDNSNDEKDKGMDSNLEIDEEVAEDIEKVSLSNKLKGLIGTVESIYNDNIVKRTSFVEINGYIQKSLGKKVIDDVEAGKTVIKDKNNYLHFGLTEEPIDVSCQADNINDLSEFCKENDMEFVYVQAPFKVMSDEQLPEGITDYSNLAADDLGKELIDYGVDYLDLREKMKEDSLTYDEVFYKTDHHWTIESGFWAYTKILGELNNKYNLTFENQDITTDINNYDIKFMEKSFIGSQGRRVGQYYTDIDDVTLYIPKFTASFRYLLFDSNKNLVKERRGDFYESLINVSDMESEDIYTSKYESFLETNNETHIINNTISNDKKVLFIKDSFARPVAAYMGSNVKEVRLLDLRTYNGSTYDYIKEYNPDIVIMLYNPSMIKNEEMFDFRY